jgi:hypothetical protein
MRPRPNEQARPAGLSRLAKRPCPPLPATGACCR